MLLYKKLLLMTFGTSLVFILFPFSNTPSGPGPSHYRGSTIIQRHTTLGRTPLDE